MSSPKEAEQARTLSPGCTGTNYHSAPASEHVISMCPDHVDQPPLAQRLSVTLEYEAMNAGPVTWSGTEFLDMQKYLHSNQYAFRQAGGRTWIRSSMYPAFSSVAET